MTFVIRAKMAGADLSRREPLSYKNASMISSLAKYPLALYRTNVLVQKHNIASCCYKQPSLNNKIDPLLL